MNNFFGLIIAIVYVFAVIGIAEIVRRVGGYRSDFTRKIIHIGAGMLSWFVPLLFDSPWFFVIACLGFMILNLADRRYGFFSAMASEDPSNLGTVYFPLAAGVVALIFWEQPPLLVAALMPLTWGDGLASVIGMKFGKHKYSVFGHSRSIEGSITFIVAAGFFTWLALWMIGGPPDITPVEAVLPALLVALTTGLIEALTPLGLDNLTITIGSVIVLNAWPF